MLVDYCLDALNKALFLVYSIVTLILSDLQEELGYHLAQYDTNCEEHYPAPHMQYVHGDRNKAGTCKVTEGVSGHVCTVHVLSSSTRKKVHVSGAGILQTNNC